jgi:stearoyl-CoA desaturase (Delta-9 desaturase)
MLGTNEATRTEHEPMPAAPPRSRTAWVNMVPSWLLQIAAVVGVVWMGWSWKGFALALALYFARMFALTAGYHRYFAHRSFRTSRGFQFVLGVLGATCLQKGPLWWSAHHRRHHKYSDRPGDLHSPVQGGLLWAHIGWMALTDTEETQWPWVRDLAKFPELRWLNQHWYLPPLLLAVVLTIVAGPWGLLWGFFVSTTLLFHGTWTVNSIAHRFGSRRYKTPDDSRNNPLIALITLGEGWHNNHHHYQRSERQGFFWWEFDITHYILKVLSWTGLVWDLHEPPRAVREAY